MKQREFRNDNKEDIDHATKEKKDTEEENDDQEEEDNDNYFIERGYQ